MNALKNLSLILLLSLAFTGCHNKSSKINDFNLLLYAPEYASGFDIKGAGGKESVLITVRNPWQGADSVTTWLFIVRNGEEVPEGFAGQVLKGDAKRIVAMSSTHIAMLDAIGEVRCITGVSGIDYISNPDIQARRDSIGDVGYEGNINYELLLSLDPALVLLNSVYGSGVTSKLFVNVREKRSLCYYASSAVEKFKGLMIVSSGISFDQYETARDAILAELDACRRGEITPEELESARRSLISAVRAGLDTPAALDDWYIGMSIEPCDDPETMLQKLPALTVEDVVRAARRITTDTIYFLKGDEA